MTERQKEIYDFIVAYIQENLYPPCHREIGAAVGWTSEPVVNYNLKQLQKKGYIEVKENTPRGIKVKGYKFVKEDVEVDGYIEAIKKQPKAGEWISCSERLPESDNYILLSFENYSIPEIGRYEIGKDGSGAFYPGDDEKSYVSYGLFVNAWQPLPEPYKGE